MALRYADLQQRGAFTKPRTVEGSRTTAERRQALDEKKFETQYGKDVITPASRMVKTPVTRHIPGIEEEKLDISKRAITLSEQKEESKEIARVAQFNKNQQKPANRGRVLQMKKEHPELAPLMNQILDGLDRQEGQDGRLVTSGNVYAKWKEMKALGMFGMARMDMLKAADALELKGLKTEADKKRIVANAIVRPGFLDELYNVPESLRATVKTPTTERLYETVDGWKPRGEAIGLEKPKTEKTAKLYPTTEGYLPADQAEGEMPPAKTAPSLGPEAKEIHDVKMTMTSQKMETQMRGLKDDKTVFDSIGPYFNNTNKLNKVAYWDTSYFDDETNIITLNKKAIKMGWTPKKIQEMALKYGVSVEEILKETGIIK